MNNNGFTLVETLIYIAIVGLVIGALVQFSLTISQSRNKTFITQEVQSNVQQLIQEISYAVQSAAKVNTTTSVFALHPGVLSLQMSNPLENPTIITVDQNSGALVIKKGELPTSTLTTNQVIVQSLEFMYMQAGESDSVHVQATVASKNNDSQDVSYEQSIQTSITTRR